MIARRALSSQYCRAPRSAHRSAPREARATRTGRARDPHISCSAARERPAAAARSANSSSTATRLGPSPRRSTRWRRTPLRARPERVAIERLALPDLVVGHPVLDPHNDRPGSRHLSPPSHIDYSADVVVSSRIGYPNVRERQAPPIRVAPAARAGGRNAGATSSPPPSGSSSGRAMAATTMAAIAAEAGVALKTVYLVFDTKSGVLRAVWNGLLRGEDEDRPVAEQPWYRRGARRGRPRSSRLALERAELGRRASNASGPSSQAIRSAATADPEIGKLSGAHSGRVPREASGRSSSCSDERGELAPASVSTEPPTSSG